jgi:HK97 gp10 family phage protein
MTIEAKGFKQIDERLAALGSKVGTRIVRRALLIAADPIVEQAQHNVATQSNRSGALALAVGKRFVVGASGGLASLLPDLGKRFAAVIAPLKANRVATALYNLVYGTRRRNLFHGHFIEFGTRFMQAKPFLGPALFARARDAINIFRAEVKDGIERELRRR